MKYIKYFENNFEEDWEDVDPDDESPFKSILKYGKDGPEFKCGDRVIINELNNYFIGFSHPLLNINNKKGIIVNYYIDVYDKYQGYYIICLDEKIHNKNYFYNKKEYNIPYGHSIESTKYYIKKI